MSRSLIYMDLVRCDLGTGTELEWPEMPVKQKVLATWKRPVRGLVSMQRRGEEVAGIQESI